MIVLASASSRVRLIVSLTATLAGSLIVVFAGGALFTKSQPGPIILFIAFLTIGNICLAIAAVGAWLQNERLQVAVR